MTSKYSGEILSVLAEHLCIPCDLCNSYFCKNGDCPPEVTTCGNSEHWRMLFERMEQNAKS